MKLLVACSSSLGAGDGRTLIGMSSSVIALLRVFGVFASWGDVEVDTACRTPFEVMLKSSSLLVAFGCIVACSGPCRFPVGVKVKVGEHVDFSGDPVIQSLRLHPRNLLIVQFEATRAAAAAASLFRLLGPLAGAIVVRSVTLLRQSSYLYSTFNNVFIPESDHRLLSGVLVHVASTMSDADEVRLW